MFLLCMTLSLYKVFNCTLMAMNPLLSCEITKLRVYSFYSHIFYSHLSFYFQLKHIIFRVSTWTLVLISVTRNWHSCPQIVLWKPDHFSRQQDYIKKASSWTVCVIRNESTSFRRGTSFQTCVIDRYRYTLWHTTKIKEHWESDNG